MAVDIWRLMMRIISFSTKCCYNNFSHQTFISKSMLLWMSQTISSSPLIPFNLWLLYKRCFSERISSSWLSLSLLHLSPPTACPVTSLNKTNRVSASVIHLASIPTSGRWIGLQWRLLHVARSGNGSALMRQSAMQKMHSRSQTELLQSGATESTDRINTGYLYSLYLYIFLHQDVLE